MTLPVGREFSKFGGPVRVDMIRADPSFHSEQWRSDVSIRSGRLRGDIWYFQVALLFHVEVCSIAAARTAEATGHAPQGSDLTLAFVKWFESVANESDDETTCVRLHWQGGQYPYDIINTESF